MHPQMSFEHCFLQLRMICELIALACLVVHGNVVSKKGNLKKAYKPAEIIHELEKLHASFYPQPGTQVVGRDGKVTEVKNIASGYLTKTELIRLWNQCGGILHRGNLKTLRSRIEPKSFKGVTDWSQKIITLLNHHQIALFNSTSQIWVIMQSKDDGKVHARYFRLV
jgi:hypothetical protein